MIRNYIKTALRAFSRHKLFTLINVIGLSIGVSAALVIYLIVRYDTNFDHFERDNSRIYRVVTTFNFSGTIAPNPGVCAPLPNAAKAQVTGIETQAYTYRITLPDVYIPQNGAKPIKFKEQKNIALADSGYFNLLDYKWLAGSTKTSLNDPYKVVLTSAQAKLYFPNSAVEDDLGKTVLYDSLRTTVSGIVEPLKENTGFTFHDFISYSTRFADKNLKQELHLNNWGGTSVKSQMFVKLVAGVSPIKVERQLNALLVANNPPKKGKTQTLSLQPLSDIHFNTQYGGITGYDEVANKNVLYSLSAIALFLLLLGCINFINLTTAQATQRAKEIGIRKTMGGSRGQLIFQFLSETFALTLFAVVISALLTPILLKWFSGFIPQGIVFNPMQQPGIFLFLLLLTVGVSFLSGLYPALILSGYKPVSVLKNQLQNSSTGRNVWMRKSLTVTQLVIAQFFIMATILVGKQIYYAIHKDLGFKKDGILTIQAPWKNRDPQREQLFLNKLHAIPQIEMVSMGNDEPASENTSSTEATYKDGKREIKTEDLSEKFGDENYIKLYHIKLLAGRNIQATDTNRAFLINNTYAKMLGFRNPQEAIGKMIDNFNGDRRMQIVGVISDFHQESIHAPISPLVLIKGDVDFSGIFHIALRPQTAGQHEWQTAIDAIQSQWKQIYPDDDFQYNFVADTVAKFYVKEQNTATLLSWATGLAILISCLGLLGLAVYTTNQRTKEIGVRKVLGASVTQVTTLLSSELAWLICIGFAVATPTAIWVMHKWMQSFADKTAMSWWVFALSGIAMLLAALFTSGIQTLKAAMANPVNSLRSE